MSADGASAPSTRTVRPVLITGGAGFIGCNLADRLAREGNDVVVYDALARPGVGQNLDWLRSRHPQRISTVIADVRDVSSLTAVARDASAIFHLAAQVAVTTSLVSPGEDFDTNVRATVSLLESVRTAAARMPIVFASTNKVYGDLGDLDMRLEEGSYVPEDDQVRHHGVNENRSLDFHTPYGCSKGAADQYMLDYSRSFKLQTAVVRMSCIYGPRQMGTEDQGWVAHFLIRALAGETINIYGDGCQVRDILHVNDAVDAYIAVWRNIGRVSGRAFNLGGGPGNAVSLIKLLTYVETLIGKELKLEFAPWRAGDQRYFVADSRRINDELGLGPAIGWRRGVAELIGWLAQQRGLTLAERVAEEAH